MLIINADDWGRSIAETDSAVQCYRAGRLTSVSAMVFMKDSERAAAIAADAGLQDVGLHLNFSQPYNGSTGSEHIDQTQASVVRFITGSKYAVLLYQPLLRQQFKDTYRAQFDEFVRLYGKPPSHVDGHQHRHLCANVVFDQVIPPGQKLRRNFSFWPGEKSALNRLYRRMIDALLKKRYRLTDFFFSLSECLKSKRLERVSSLALTSNVELMVHPVKADEKEWLLGPAWQEYFGNLTLGSYSSM